MDFTVPIKKEELLEVAISEVDNFLMDIREKIFNELRQKDVSTVQIKVVYTYFE